MLKLKGTFQKDRISVGLDIGTSSIKVVKLKLTLDKPELVSFNVQPAQVNQGEALRKIAETSDIKKVNFSVSGSPTIIRYVDFPKMNVEELRQALKFEAQKYIPFQLAEVDLDSCVINGNLSETKMLVLLAAVKKDFINQRLKLIENAGLQANIADIDSLALTNAFNFNYGQEEDLKNKTVALLNIGSSMSNLSILEGNMPRLSRDIQIGGASITQKITDILGIDFNAAEELKINPEHDKVDKIVKAGETVIGNLSGEIRVSFDYYESQSANSVVKIFLSGTGSKFLGLKDNLANLLGIAVDYWDPLRRISIPANLDQDMVKALSNQLGVAVGLALRS